MLTQVITRISPLRYSYGGTELDQQTSVHAACRRNHQDELVRRDEMVSLLNQLRLRIGAAVCVMLGAVISVSALAQEAGWRQLVSLGISVAFPAHLVEDDSERRNGRFVLADGAHVEFNVSDLRTTPLDAFVHQHVLRRIDVTYRRKAANWMAYSGYRGHEVVYGRTVLSCDGQYAHSFVLTYPRAARATYDAIAERMSLTMRVDSDFTRRNCG
jgi:hypothetical protein